MEPLNNDSYEQPEEASKLPASLEKAESVTSETPSSHKMKIEELTGEEDMMEVDSALTAVKSSASSKHIHTLFIHFLIFISFFIKTLKFRISPRLLMSHHLPCQPKVSTLLRLPWVLVQFPVHLRLLLLRP